MAFYPRRFALRLPRVPSFYPPPSPINTPFFTPISPSAPLSQLSSPHEDSTTTATTRLSSSLTGPPSPRKSTLLNMSESPSPNTHSTAHHLPQPYSPQPKDPMPSPSRDPLPQAERLGVTVNPTASTSAPIDATPLQSVPVAGRQLVGIVEPLLPPEAIVSLMS